MSDPGMSEYLAAFYGTNGETEKTAESEEEDLVKQAAVELFCKVAAEQNIDLASLPDAQVEQLFENFVSNVKTAGEEPDAIVEEASQEFEQKKEAAAEFAKYDFFGRQMAHAYVDELKKIAAAAEGPGEEDEGGEGQGEEAKEAGWSPPPLHRGSLRDFGHKLKDTAGKAWKHVKDAPSDVGHAFKGTQRSQGLQARKNLAEPVAERMLGSHAMRNVPQGAREEAMKAIKYEAHREADRNVRHGTAKMVGAYGGAGAAATGAGVGIHHVAKKKKAASALDELAMERAIYKAAEAGFNPDEAADRILAVATLGMQESEKIASAEDVGSAVEVRALEVLEAAGYPVTWAA